MTHIPPMQDTAYDDEQKAVAKAIASGPRGSVRGPFAVLIHNAKLAMSLQQVGEYLRYHSTLDKALTELVILMVSRHWNCEHEWFAHAPLARAEGVSEADVEAIRRRAEPKGLTAAQNAAIKAAKAVLENRDLPDADFAELQKHFDKASILDIIGICGYYTSLAMVLNFAKNPLPGGAEPQLKNA